MFQCNSLQCNNLPLTIYDNQQMFYVIYIFYFYCVTNLNLLPNSLALKFEKAVDMWYIKQMCTKSYYPYRLDIIYS